MRTRALAGMVVGLVVGLGLGTLGCADDGSKMASGAGGGGSGGSASGRGGSGGGEAFVLTSPAFMEDEMIPVAHTCAGADTSPAFNWTSGPAGTQSYAMILADIHPTIPVKQWIIWGIPDTARSLPAGLSEGPTPANPNVPVLEHQISNKEDSRGYQGPCPEGAQHKYLFRLYALETSGLPGITLDSTVEEVSKAILDNLVAFTDLYGIF